MLGQESGRKGKGGEKAYTWEGDSHWGVSRQRGPLPVAGRSGEWWSNREAARFKLGCCGNEVRFCIVPRC
jgi:hypothetical protein